ncbi:outer membrane beta-barrel protein [Microbulbifer halophilus]|uniref:Outer membrane beta-barrel protein n=2 Tax=Microbulbifer halophilus TaxID=453963 RepID=A0ABW5ECI4_9GAMM|nr:outer membrane beta-barrel protein [Microbulbifer halophilus]MCW8126425.1 outer membrane beta-barrel protein [Microbulbifer halophilus]
MVSAAVVAGPSGSPPERPAPLWNWSGFYAGVHGGGGRTDINIGKMPGRAIFGDRVEMPLFLFGGQLGYNFHFRERWLLGLEADAAWAWSEGMGTCGAFDGDFVSFNCRADTDSVATIAGRAGYSLGSGGRTLVYAKAGAARISGDLEIYSTNQRDPKGSTHSGLSRWGWTVGAGIEQALTPNWSLKFEYNYLDFDDKSFTTPPSAFVDQGPDPDQPDQSQVQLRDAPPLKAEARQKQHLFKVGLNYHFGDASRRARPSGPERESGWEVAGGVRYLRSSIKTQYDYQGQGRGDLVSRLTFDHMHLNAGELFARVDSPWNLFVKGYVGLGHMDSGRQNDEDWAANDNDFGYSNTISRAQGNSRYATADIGYNFLRSPEYRAGLFAGYSYYDLEVDATGCEQIGSSEGGCTPDDDFAVPGRLIIHRPDRWKGIRLGADGQVALNDCLTLGGEFAYLTRVHFDGRDHHLLRQTTTYFYERANKGEGVQLEARLSYRFSEAFSASLGARYQALWSRGGHQRAVAFTPAKELKPGDGADLPGEFVIDDPTGERHRMESLGVFLEASYAFGH